MEPIVFRCQCGKKLQAQSEFAGRRLHCMGCARILTIPRPFGQAHPTLLIGLPPTSGLGDFIRFTCSCGRKLKAYEHHAGSAVDCPACGRELTIPAKHSDTPLPTAYDPLPIQSPATARTAAAPATNKVVLAPVTARTVPTPPARRLAAPARGAALDSLFAQTVTPWPSAELRNRNGAAPSEPRARSGRWLAVLLVLGLGLLAAEWHFAPKTKASANVPGTSGFELTHLIPTNAVAVATVRYGDLWSDWRINKGESELLRWARDQVKLLNLDNFFIERVTVVLLPEDPKRQALVSQQAGGKSKAKGPVPSASGSGNEPVIIVQMPFQTPFETFLKSFFKKPTPVRVGKQNFYVEDVSAKKNAGQKKDAGQKRGGAEKKDAGQKIDPNPLAKALYLVGDQTLIMSSVNNLRRFIDSDRTQDPALHPMADLLAAAPNHDAVIGLIARPHSPFNNISGAEFSDVRSGLITVDEGRSDTLQKRTVEMWLKLPNEEKALAQKNELDNVLAKLGPSLPAEAYHVEAVGDSVHLQLKAVAGPAKAADVLWLKFADIAAKAPPLYSRL